MKAYIKQIEYYLPKVKLENMNKRLAKKREYCIVIYVMLEK